MLAKTSYSVGLLEVVQGLTTDFETQKLQAEQVRIPAELWGKTYGEIAEALLGGTVGPCRVLPLGLLQKADGDRSKHHVVPTNPAQATQTGQGDLLILMANARWTLWAENQWLHLLGGKPSRSH